MVNEMTKRDIDATIEVLTEALKKDADKKAGGHSERQIGEFISTVMILLKGLLVDINRIANAQERIADAQETLAKLGLKHG